MISSTSNELKSQVVLIRSQVKHEHVVFVSNDNHRKYHDDFDVRTHSSHEERSKVNLVHLHDDVYHIKSHTNPNYFIFCSNDHHRKHGDDFDVRAHTSVEPRNEWIITRVNTNVYTIKSKTNPDHFLFLADDGSNAYNQDFDVRTHPHVEPRNQWVIENFIHSSQQGNPNVIQSQGGNKKVKKGADQYIQLIEFSAGWTGKMVIRFLQTVNLTAKTLRFKMHHATLTCEPWGVNVPIKYTVKGEKVVLAFGKTNGGNADYMVNAGDVITLQFSTSNEHYSVKGLKIK